MGRASRFLLLCKHNAKIKGQRKNKGTTQKFRSRLALPRVWVRVRVREEKIKTKARQDKTTQGKTNIR
jgi:hypothetical protein